MHAPLYSTITLFAELIVSAVIYYALFQGYKKNKFPTVPVALALFYEVAFNISYMVSQVHNRVQAAKVESLALILLAITHGILSLIMFLALIVFFVLAYLTYRKGDNYFVSHKILTFTFLFFWTFSILSGILLYIFSYLL